MNPPKDTHFLQDDENQLTFLLDSPLPQRSSTRAEVTEQVLHLRRAVRQAVPSVDERQ
ncbi:MAG: hypothetical protein NTW26_10130 [bacterium]|nr:hypothetical protein [bacterium]